jgi:hypothetical protein
MVRAGASLKEVADGCGLTISQLRAPQERSGAFQEGGEGAWLRGAVLDASRELVGQEGAHLQHARR